MTKINRILSEPPRDNTWLDYHREMRTKHRYFVRGDKIKPYYTDAPLEAIYEDLNGLYIDIIDWGWDCEKWDEMPYMYRKTVDSTVEYYARENTSKAGVKVNGAWLEQYYCDDSSSFFWTAEGYCSVRHGQLFTRESSGEWYLTTSLKSLRIDGAPIDEILPLIRRINAKRQRGFYRPIIEFLFDEGLGRTQL